MDRPTTPAQAWSALAAGNTRFVSNAPQHPNQDSSRRSELTAGQTPFATFFGCADSRVAAEVIFDQGLGDLFVIRTAGHVIDFSVLGSLEFGVHVLGTPLIVILGHDTCGAVKAGIDHVSTGTMPPGFIRDLVERVSPSVVAARAAGATTVDEVEAAHVGQTIDLIVERSRVIADAVEAGRVAIVGLVYQLSDGRANLVRAVGDIGAVPGA